MSFHCDSPLDFYFLVGSGASFVINGNNGSGKTMFVISKCGNALYSKQNVESFNVSYTNFDSGFYIALASEAKVNKIVLEDCSFVGPNAYILSFDATLGGKEPGTDYSVSMARLNISHDGGSFYLVGYSGSFTDILYSAGPNTAIKIQLGTWNFTNVHISSNTAGGVETFAGAMMVERAVVTLTQSSFSKCNAGNAGAVYFNDVNAQVRDVVFTDCFCTAQNCQGGAFSHFSSVSSELTNVTFIGNRASYGAAIELRGIIDSYSINGAMFINNTAEVTGSCIDCCGGVEFCSPIYVNTNSLAGYGNSGGTNITCPT